MVSTRSPPIAAAIAAKSWSELTTRTLASAPTARPKRPKRKTAREKALKIFMTIPLERMGAMGADRELELEEGLVRGVADTVVPAPQLASELGELARPEGQGGRRAVVAQESGVGAGGRLRAAAHEPAFGELPVAGDEPADGVLGPARLLA